MRQVLSAVLLAGFALGGLRAEDAFRWQGTVQAGQALEIKNVNGGIKAEPALSGQVEVVAVKSAKRSNPVDVRIEVVPHGNGVTLCAVYPTPAGSPPNECRPGSEGRMNNNNNDTHVEFTVRVPAGVSLTAKTVNGNVEVRDLRSNANISTVNGNVNVNSTGIVAAKTVNGGITASLGDANWRDRNQFSTVNGGVNLTLPSTTSTDVMASTVNGSIESDFAVTMRGRISRQRLEGTIGSGGRELEVKTVNGSIKLRKAS